MTCVHTKVIQLFDANKFLESYLLRLLTHLKKHAKSSCCFYFNSFIQSS